MIDLEYGIGDIVSHNNDPESLWKVGEIRMGINICWVWGESCNSGTGQFFPSGSLKLVIPKKEKNVGSIKIKRTDGKKFPGDIVSKVNINKAMSFLKIDPDQIGHLSAGLIKMNIINRLRAEWRNDRMTERELMKLLVN